MPSSAVFPRGVSLAGASGHCRAARGSRAQGLIPRHIVIVRCFHIHSRFVRQKTFPNNQLSAPSHAIPGWRRPRCLGLRCPEGTGQAERHNLTARSLPAGAHPILAYKLRCGLPRNFPVVEYLSVPTASLEGWRGQTGTSSRRAARSQHP